jgi:hypothetical protein
LQGALRVSFDPASTELLLAAADAGVRCAAVARIDDVKHITKPRAAAAAAAASPDALVLLPTSNQQNSHRESRLLNEAQRVELCWHVHQEADLHPKQDESSLSLVRV